MYPEEMCDAERKPETTKECDTPQTCEYQWIKTQWSKVSYIVLKNYYFQTILEKTKLRDNFIALQIWIFSENLKNVKYSML